VPENAFDESKVDEALSIIYELGDVDVSKYRVIGDCVRYRPNDRYHLSNIRDEILNRLTERKSIGQENYLIWGTPGGGKTTLIEELGKAIDHFARFEHIYLSKENKETFSAKLTQLQTEPKPVLCLVDEVDSCISEQWPYEAMLAPLGTPRKIANTCYVLVGTAGNNAEELEAAICSGRSPESEQKGKDVMRRITFKRKDSIPSTNLGDKILIGVCQLTRKTGKPLLQVEIPVLLYFALHKQLDSPSKISDLAVQISTRMKPHEDRVMWTHLFDYTEGDEMLKFHLVWKDMIPKDSFMWVENKQVQRIEPTPGLDQVFESPKRLLDREMQQNFLRDFDHSAQPNYTRLLSQDFRRLFFSFFNKHDLLLITGHEGVGKTFNVLLIGKKLSDEGYRVYYCSVTNRNLLPDNLPNAPELKNAKPVLIVDDCQEDLKKTRQLRENIGSLRTGGSSLLKIVFLSHPLETYYVPETFGKDIQIIAFKERYTDLKTLAWLFFRKMGMYDRLSEFLDWTYRNDPSKAFCQYKNMRFWNIYFNAMESSRKVVITETEFLNFAHKFFKERNLIQFGSVLSKLMPFFANGLSVHMEYVDKQLGINGDQLKQLESAGIADHALLDWENKKWQNSSALFVRSKIHPTEAKILELVLQKCEGMGIDDLKSLTDYVATYFENLYSLIQSISFHNADLLERLCREDRFQSVVQSYLKQRHLGKQLDRTIRILSKLPQELRDKFVEDEMLEQWISKLNDKRYFMNSKVSLLASIYKISPTAACKCLEKLDVDTFAGNFKSVPIEVRGGVSTFKRFIELAKNVWSFYLFSTSLIFEDTLNAGTLASELRKQFRDNGYLLSDKAGVEPRSIGEWKIFDCKNVFLIRKTRSGAGLDVHYSFNDSERQALLVKKIKEFLDQCLMTFLDRFEMDDFFSQMHWLLKKLNGIKLDETTRKSLADYVFDFIPPQKIVDWIRIKDIAAHELRYVLKTSRYVNVETEGKTKRLYDFLKDSIDYKDIKRVFENPRSSLYAICIMCRNAHELLAKYFYQYSLEECFVNKIKTETDLYCINKSVEFVEDNLGLRDEQKHSIAHRILFNTVDIEHLPRFAIRSARAAERLKRQFDIDKETQQFIDYRQKYATTQL